MGGSSRRVAASRVRGWRTRAGGHGIAGFVAKGHLLGSHPVEQKPNPSDIGSEERRASEIRQVPHQVGGPQFGVRSNIAERAHDGVGGPDIGAGDVAGSAAHEKDRELGDTDGRGFVGRSQRQHRVVVQFGHVFDERFRAHRGSPTDSIGAGLIGVCPSGGGERAVGIQDGTHLPFFGAFEGPASPIRFHNEIPVACPLVCPDPSSFHVRASVPDPSVRFFPVDLGIVDETFVPVDSAYADLDVIFIEQRLVYSAQSKSSGNGIDIRHDLVASKMCGAKGECGQGNQKQCRIHWIAKLYNHNDKKYRKGRTISKITSMIALERHHDN